MAKISKFKVGDVCVVVSGSYPDKDDKAVHFMSKGDVVEVIEIHKGCFDMSTRVNGIDYYDNRIMTDQWVYNNHIVKVGEL